MSELGICLSALERQNTEDNGREMSATPRTDAAWISGTTALLVECGYLERENTELRAEIERLRESHSDEAISDLEMRFAVMRQDIERMRPVVEEARKYVHVWPHDLPSAVHNYESGK